MVLTPIAERLWSRFNEPRQRQKRSDVETQVVLNTSDHYKKETLQPEETTIVNFRSSSDKDLKGNYPFNSIDGYNGTTEKIHILINQREHLQLTKPANSLIGNSFPDTGIYSVKIRNVGSSEIELDNLDLTITKDVEGVERANV